MTRKHKYQRCQECKELVIDAENCANCAAMNPLSLTKRIDVGMGKRPSITLDFQEGNSEEDSGGQLFKVKGHRR